MTVRKRKPKKLKLTQFSKKRVFHPLGKSLVISLFILITGVFFSVKLTPSLSKVLGISTFQSGISNSYSISSTPTTSQTVLPTSGVAQSSPNELPAQKIPTNTPTPIFQRMPANQLPTSTPTPTPFQKMPPQSPIPTQLPTSTPTPVPIAPPQGYGLYEGCDPYLGQSCLDNLSQMAIAGFSLVLNYGQLTGSDSDEVAYFTKANSLKMKVILPLNNQVFWNGTNLLTYYSTLAKTCRTPQGNVCSNNTEFITYVIDLVKNSPALWGYYVGDELDQYQFKDPNFHSKWITYSNLIHSIDPTHPRLIIMGTWTKKYANPNLVEFSDGAEVIGQDYYPIGDDNIVSYTQTNIVAKAVQQAVSSAHKRSAFALQFFSEQEYYPPARCETWPTCAPFPNKNELQQMTNDILNNSQPSLILFYSYYDLWRTNKYDMIKNDFENQQQHWNDLTSVIKPTLLNYANNNGSNNPVKLLVNSVENLFGVRKNQNAENSNSTEETNASNANSASQSTSPISIIVSPLVNVNNAIVGAINHFFVSLFRKQ